MLSLFVIGLVAAMQLSLAEGDSCGRIVCYHTNWSQYRPSGGKFFPDNIDPSLCTHVIYAFAKIAGNHLAAFEWNDDSTDWSVGLYEKFQNLKKQNPALKTSLAVGGWNLGSAPFTAIVKSPSNRQDFITQSIKFLRDRDFDGLDLDWEYPANRGSPPEDRQHFSEFVKELKKAFVAEAASSGKPRLLLSSAVAAGKDKIDTAYDIPVLSQELDFISLMSYDLHGSWETATGHHSGLYARSSETGDARYLNIDYAAKYWVQKGLDPAKLNIGLGLYGRSFTLASASNYGVGAPATKGGAAGRYTREAGFIAYYEVCDMKKQGGQVEWIDEQSSPYIHHGNEWVGYDNPDSLREKVRYTKKNNFGGVMVWALPLDDFSGSHCGQGPFPLMHAIADECQHNTGQLHTPAPTSRPPVTNAPHTNAPNTNTNSPQVTHPPHHTLQPAQFTCPAKDGFYASPRSCMEYFICASHISYSVHCADGLVFNPNTGFCDWPGNYKCTIGDSPGTGQVTSAPVEHQTQPTQHVTNRPPAQTQRPGTGAPTTQQPATMRTTFTPAATQRTTPGVDHDMHDFCKDQGDGVHRDPVHCDHFIECSNGYTYIFNCAPGSVYNEAINNCDKPENVPSCHGGQWQTAGPVTTMSPTTVPTTPQPVITTQVPSTAAVPTTMQPTTQQPATQQPTTQQPTIEPSTTQQPTATQAPTTHAPITDAPSTQQPTTQQPTTQQPTTQQPTTRMPTTHVPITEAPTTQPPVQTTQDISTFCNGHDDGIFADPSDCAHFIECANGNTYREPCAPGTAWNDGIKTCDLVANVRGCDHAA